MRRLLIRRIISIPVILFLLSIFIFSLVLFLSPSERVAVFVSSGDALQNTSLEELIEKYELDAPVHVQYLKWIKGVAKGDLGWSNSARMPIAEALSLRIPATIELLLAGQFMVFFGGIFLGTLAALHRNRFADHFIRLATIIGVSLPEFVVALFLLVIFYVCLDLLPPGRLGLAASDVVYSSSFVHYTGSHIVDGLLNGRLDVCADAVRHLILPTVAYSIGGLAATVRLIRSSLIENLSRGYVNTARLKGLSSKVVMNRHVRRNALLPLITFTGMRVPVLLSGSVVVETIFDYKGMGLFIVTAAQGLDFPSIIAASLVVGLIIILSNLVVDLSYSFLNPVVRLG